MLRRWIQVDGVILNMACTNHFCFTWGIVPYVRILHWMNEKRNVMKGMPAEVIGVK